MSIDSNKFHPDSEKYNSAQNLNPPLQNQLPSLSSLLSEINKVPYPSVKSLLDDEKPRSIGLASLQNLPPLPNFSDIVNSSKFPIESNIEKNIQAKSLIDQSRQSSLPPTIDVPVIHPPSFPSSSEEFKLYDFNELWSQTEVVREDPNNPIEDPDYKDSEGEEEQKDFHIKKSVTKPTKREIKPNHIASASKKRKAEETLDPRPAKKNPNAIAKGPTIYKANATPNSDKEVVTISYSGNYSKGFADGKGMALYQNRLGENILCYDGFFLQGRPHTDHGTFAFSDASGPITCTGKVKSGKLHGKGSVTLMAEGLYKCHYIKGVAQSTGRLTLSYNNSQVTIDNSFVSGFTKEQYEEMKFDCKGKWIDGKPDGLMEFKFQAELRFIGEFDCNTFKKADIVQMNLGGKWIKIAKEAPVDFKFCIPNYVLKKQEKS